MSVKFVAGVAATLGGIGIVLCLIAVPTIFSEIKNIREELADEMNIFKVLYSSISIVNFLL